MNARRTAVSLFTSGGIGDLAVRAAGYDVLVSNEVLADRHGVFQRNFPHAHAVTADIWRAVPDIDAAARRLLAGRELDLLYATPPCQGMSKNGRGKLLSAVRSGGRPPLDPRNRLIIPTMQVARHLQPRVIIIENVPEMADTLICDEKGRVCTILDYVRRSLGPDYVGGAEVVEFADYGVPQFRQRLIAVFTRCPRVAAAFARDGGRFDFLPPPTHGRGGGRKPWVTVRQAIAELPPLDAATAESATSSLPYHRVPLLDEAKHWWVRSTPPGGGAFDNQCDACGFDANPTHSARRDGNGVNRASTETVLHCQRCGALLPRPSVVGDDGRPRLMRGFTSAYRRMSYDKPASTLTRNLSYACSDRKLHPTQHRVLSLREAFRIHTVDRYDYIWERRDGRRLSDKTVREIIGESIPPAGFEVITKHVAAAADGTLEPASHRSNRAELGPLFAISASG